MFISLLKKAVFFEKLSDPNKQFEKILNVTTCFKYLIYKHEKNNYKLINKFNVQYTFHYSTFNRTVS